jgi:alkylation response protein AidB-like acyl-CoA dehydrogenase
MASVIARLAVRMKLMDAMLGADVKIANVTVWCREHGVDRRAFYRHRQRVFGGQLAAAVPAAAVVTRRRPRGRDRPRRQPPAGRPGARALRSRAPGPPRRAIERRALLTSVLAVVPGRGVVADEWPWPCERAADLTFISSACKCFASDVAMEVTTDAVQLLGGYGYVSDYPVERMMRDAKITQIYEGTNQIQRIVMARQLLK